MPHNKTRSGSGVTLDRRRALTIKAVGKSDICRSGDPFKIPKRRVSGEDDCAGADVAKCARKYPKIHWSQLATSCTSSQPSHLHNGNQTGHPHQNDMTKLEVSRRQVKVILTDVLQTEEGQRYLSSCGPDFKKMCQMELKRGPRERTSDIMTAEHGERRIASPSCRDQIKSVSSKGTESPTEKNDVPPSKEIRSPLLKRLRRLNHLQKHSEPALFNKEERASHAESVSVQSEQMHMPVTKNMETCDTEENELSPVKDGDLVNSSNASAFYSDGTLLPNDEQNYSEHISKCSAAGIWRHTSSLSLSRHRNRVQLLGSELHSTQHISDREMQESAERIGEEERENQEKEVAAAVRNGEVIEEGGGARESVLRLSLAGGDQLEKGLADAEAQPKYDELQNSRKASKLHTPEPIVLSSEEEEEEENNRTSDIQTLVGAKDPLTPQRPALAMERKKNPDVYTHASEIHIQGSSYVDSTFRCSSVMELQFSALYMAGFSVLSNGLMKITEDEITIALKDPSGAEVKASLATAHICKYSVWDGLIVQGSALIKQDETPPPSLLLLWLSEAQANRLSSELAIMQPGTHPVEGSACMVLCVSEPLKGIEGALLASKMDIVGLKHGTTELLSPLTHMESMKLLQSCQDTHLLQLLCPKMDTHTSLHESVTIRMPAEVAATTIMDPDVQANSIYTLCHLRAEDTYCVSMANEPGSDWIPYKHSGPARRLIQFPPPPCKGAITVSTEDLECLDSGEFLNDVIIDFYLKYLLVQKAPPASVKRSHIFSSFFYKQLTRRDNANEDSVSTPAQLRRHQRVRTWTRHVDIFEKDFLFVPVNQEAHWYLVVVCYPGMDEPQWIEREDQDSVQSYSQNSSDSMAKSENQEVSWHNSDGDKISDENTSRTISTSSSPNCTEKTCKHKTVCKRPCILIMDSLKLSVHERIFKLLREYLQVEWEVKRGGQRDFSAERMVGSHCRVPLQDNSSDCGLYLLQYAESFLQDPVVHFELPLRLECWFPRQQVREKREEIRDLVLHLYRFQQGSMRNISSEGKVKMGNVTQ